MLFPDPKEPLPEFVSFATLSLTTQLELWRALRNAPRGRLFAACSTLGCRMRSKILKSPKDWPSLGLKTECDVGNVAERDPEQSPQSGQLQQTSNPLCLCQWKRKIAEFLLVGRRIE